MNKSRMPNNVLHQTHPLRGWFLALLGAGEHRRLCVTRMKKILLLVALVSLGCVAQNNKIVLRGELHWDNSPLTITECRTGEIYELGPMASNQYFHLSQQVDALKNEGNDEIVVEILGNPNQIMNSAGTVIIGSWIEIREIIKVESGVCNEKSA